MACADNVVAIRWSGGSRVVRPGAAGSAAGAATIEAIVGAAETGGSRVVRPGAAGSAAGIVVRAAVDVAADVMGAAGAAGIAGIAGMAVGEAGSVAGAAGASTIVGVVVVAEKDGNRVVAVVAAGALGVVVVAEKDGNRVVVAGATERETGIPESIVETDVRVLVLVCALALILPLLPKTAPSWGNRARVAAARSPSPRITDWPFEFRFDT